MNQQPVQGEVSSIGKWYEGQKRTVKHCKPPTVHQTEYGFQ